MMFEPVYTVGPSSQPSFIEAPHAQTSPHQALYGPGQAPWMDLAAQISSLGTHMEELVVVSDTQFYSMEDCMDQQQATFEHILRRLDRQESQHEDMMAYLRSVFPPPPPSQP